MRNESISSKKHGFNPPFLDALQIDAIKKTVDRYDRIDLLFFCSMSGERSERQKDSLLIAMGRLARCLAKVLDKIAGAAVAA